MRIDWLVIPHNEQRYDSSGDWYWTDDETLRVRQSQLSRRDYEFLEGVHEVIEAMLCRFQGIPQQMVDDFDMPFEEAHKRGDSHYPCGCSRTEYSGPGDDRHAPYYRQHKVADAIERQLAAVLGINWEDYEKEVDKPPE